MKLKLPAGPFGAYLFDCDGTIADSMPLHYIAWKKALGEWNCEFDEKLFYAWGGMPIAEIISALNKKDGLTMPVETVAHRKESLYFELLPRAQGRSRSCGAYRSPARPHSLCCRLRKHQGIRDRLAHLAETPRSIRNLRLRWRLQAGQARPGSLSARRIQSWSAARILFGFRRHGNGHPGRHVRRNVFRQSPSSVGKGCSILQTF